MKVLLDILNASTLADLPPVCRSFWEDDTEFAEVFACCDDATKCEFVADAVRRCLDLNIRDDHNCLRMFMLVILSREDEYEDEVSDTQEVVVPMLHASAPAPAPAPVAHVDLDLQRLTRKLEQANAEVERLKTELERVTHEQTDRPKPAPKNPDEKRGRGRPPKNPENSDLKCHLCNIGFSSFGARYNHYASKQHTEACVCFLDKVRKVVEQDGVDNRNLKLRVEARSHLYDPEFTTENPTPADITAIEKYVKSNSKNPIADLLFVEGKERKYLSGKTYLSWSSVQL